MPVPKWFKRMATADKHCIFHTKDVYIDRNKTITSRWYKPYLSLHKKNSEIPIPLNNSFSNMNSVGAGLTEVTRIFVGAGGQKATGIMENSCGKDRSRLAARTRRKLQLLCCVPRPTRHFWPWSIIVLFVWPCLTYKSYFFSQRIIFFSHTKSANSTFSHGL